MPDTHPKDIEKNMILRANMRMKAANNEDIQSKFRALCTADIFSWINLFVYTYNPRIEDSKIPFITYEFQDDLIATLCSQIDNQEDILIDKSRDMGVSWCVITVFTWYWLYGGQGMDFLCGSRKEQYVDKIGDMATLLQKVRFILNNLPYWLKPKGFNRDQHASYMKIINPETGSLISGEATNENFSRGGRQRGILFDEFAFWEVDAPAWRSSADTTNCRIAVSTPYGFNNHFAKLKHSDNVKNLSLHWTLHPDKAKDAYNTTTKEPLTPDQAFEEWKKTQKVSSPWYENELIRRQDAIEIAQELDISYEGSQEGVLFEWDEMHKATNINMPLSKDRNVIVFDPSGGGDDEAVIYASNNGAIAERKIFGETNATEISAEVVRMAYKHKAQVICGDAIGNDVLELVKILLGRNENRIKLLSFKSSEKAENTHKFFNKRAEAYWDASDQMKAGNLQVDDDYVLKKQLSATKYEKKNGRIILIRKEDIRKVCGSSPDRADAWMLIAYALKFTHSRREVEYRQKYRQSFTEEERAPNSAYGDWGDE